MDVQYVTDEKGKRTAVLLSISQWQKIVAEIGEYDGNDELAEIMAEPALVSSITKGRSQSRERRGRPINEVEV